MLDNRLRTKAEDIIRMLDGKNPDVDPERCMVKCLKAKKDQSANVATSGSVFLPDQKV